MPRGSHALTARRASDDSAARSHEDPAALYARAMARTGSALTTVILAATVGCEAFHSDAKNFSRQRRAERARAVAGMRAATQQTARGTDVAGEALTRLVRGQTHLFVYGAARSGRAARYVEYSFFRSGRPLRLPQHRMCHERRGPRRRRLAGRRGAPLRAERRMRAFLAELGPEVTAAYVRAAALGGRAAAAHLSRLRVKPASRTTERHHRR
jgi:hypothetical protein